MDKVTLTPDELARLLSVSRGTIYKAIRENLIPHMHLCGRIIIPKAPIDRMLNGEVSGSDTHNAGS